MANSSTYICSITASGRISLLSCFRSDANSFADSALSRAAAAPTALGVGDLGVRGRQPQTYEDNRVIEATPSEFLPWNAPFRFTGVDRRDITLMG